MEAAPSRFAEATYFWDRLRYNDEVMADVMGQGMATESALLFGRFTYEEFYRYWPKQPQPPRA
jgi:hypothetical protein